MTNKTPQHEESSLSETVDTFIRDVTQVGSISKSEVRRRLEEMFASTIKRTIEEIVKVLEEFAESFDRTPEHGDRCYCEECKRFNPECPESIALREAIDKIKNR